jgi:hypothetical protein
MLPLSSVITFSHVFKIVHNVLNMMHAFTVFLNELVIIHSISRLARVQIFLCMRFHFTISIRFEFTSNSDFASMKMVSVWTQQVEYQTK